MEKLRVFILAAVLAFISGMSHGYTISMGASVSNFSFALADDPTNNGIQSWIDSTGGIRLTSTQATGGQFIDNALFSSVYLDFPISAFASGANSFASTSASINPSGSAANLDIFGYGNQEQVLLTYAGINSPLQILLYPYESLTVTADAFVTKNIQVAAGQSLTQGYTMAGQSAIVFDFTGYGWTAIASPSDYAYISADEPNGSENLATSLSITNDSDAVRLIFLGFSATVAGQVLPVPEPATYALMLAGMGVVVIAARRRRRGTVRRT